MKKLLAILLRVYASLTYGHSGLDAPDPMDLNTLAKAFAWDFDAEITAEKITDDLYVLFGVGGNIETCDFDDWKRCFAINVDSSFHGCQKALPLLRAGLYLAGGDQLQAALLRSDCGCRRRGFASPQSSPREE